MCVGNTTGIGIDVVFLLQTKWPNNYGKIMNSSEFCYPGTQTWNQKKRENGKGENEWMKKNCDGFLFTKKRYTYLLEQKPLHSFI